MEKQLQQLIDKYPPNNTSYGPIDTHKVKFCGEYGESSGECTLSELAEWIEFPNHIRCVSIISGRAIICGKLYTIIPE